MPVNLHLYNTCNKIEIIKALPQKEKIKVEHWKKAIMTSVALIKYGAARE